MKPQLLRKALCIVVVAIGSSGRGSLCVPAQMTTPIDLPISVSPQVIQPVNGKLPASVSIAISVPKEACDSYKIDLTSGYSLVITGIGLTLSAPKSGKCVMTSTLTIDSSAVAGTFLVVLADSKGKPVGRADFGILDAGAAPIPPGLAPQVDVMWEVMSQKDCSDVYGKRVAQSLYCIQVKLGNNSGHPIQIAGVGFKNRIKDPVDQMITITNNSYASTRSILLRETILSPRNILFNSLQATGLLMGAFSPYFFNPNPKSHFTTAASIVSGAALQAFNIVAPDRVIVQLNNLDDQSFRDNQVLLNNAHVQTVVFVEKRALTEVLDDVATQFTTSIITTMATSDPNDRVRNAAIQDANVQANARLKRVMKTSDATIKNSHQGRSFNGDFSPLLVKLALGSLVIVGDQIEFLQRVQIQSNAATTSAVAVNVIPTTFSVALGTTNQFTATVTGTTNTAVTWSVNGIQGGNSTVGTIDDKGLYKAPDRLPTANPVTVTATSAADATKSSSATVTVTVPPVTVIVLPTNLINVAAGKTQQFTAAVTGSRIQTVSWSVNGVPLGNATVGTINATGLYTAPATAPTPNTIVVTATSAANPNVSAEVSFTIR